MTFASGSFQNSGWQTDQEGHYSRVRRERQYYEIKGKFYLLSELELQYLLYNPPKPKQGKATRIRAPKEWVPPPLESLDFGVWEDLVVEAKNHNYPTMLGILERMRPTEDEDLEVLLLYG